MTSPSAPAAVHPSKSSTDAAAFSGTTYAGFQGAELLSNDDMTELERCESIILAGSDAFVAVGDALGRIRDSRLYRETHATFEAYCQEVWGWGRRYVNLTIQSSTVVRDLPDGLGTIVPNEAAARELAKLEPERRAEVLKAASADGAPTAKAIKAAANPKPAPSEVSPPMPLPAHPAPVREDAETRQFRITRRIQEMKDDLKSFLSAQNPTRGELVSAAISMRLLAKELDFAAAQMKDEQ
mgnify:FL=1